MPQTTGQPVSSHAKGSPILVKLPSPRSEATDQKAAPTGSAEASSIGEQLRAKWDPATLTLVFPTTMSASAVGALCQDEKSNNVLLVDKLSKSEAAHTLKDVNSAKLNVVGGGDKVSTQDKRQPSQGQRTVIIQPDGRRVEVVRLNTDLYPADRCPPHSTALTCSPPKVITMQPPQDKGKVEVIVTPNRP
ncbi:unnamed protein product, partial [Ixodes hexagonus]